MSSQCRCVGRDASRRILGYPDAWERPRRGTARRANVVRNCFDAVEVGLWRMNRVGCVPAPRAGCWLRASAALCGAADRRPVTPVQLERSNRLSQRPTPMFQHRPTVGARPCRTSRNAAPQRRYMCDSGGSVPSVCSYRQIASAGAGTPRALQARHDRAGGAEPTGGSSCVQ